MDISRWKWSLGFVAFAAIVISLAYLLRERHYRVQFVVPNGFHGIFVVKADRTKGTPPERVGDFVQYVVPDNGELLTTDAQILHEWHAESARYANGEKVPEVLGESGKQHILIGLTNDNTGRMTWLIGTQAEAKQYWIDHKTWFRIESAAK